MKTSSQEKSLKQVQKIVLFLSALFFAALLFFFRSGTNSQAPIDQLARQSLELEIALANGRPTIIEFYADWCEACREMAPAMLSLARQVDDQIDIILLNVDNTKWQDLLVKYEVYGIPQLNLFDASGNLSGQLVGVKKEEDLQTIAHALLQNKELPSSSFIGKVSNLNRLPNSSIEKYNATEKILPMSHG